MKHISKQGTSRGLFAASVLALAAGFSQAAPVATWTYLTDTNFAAATFQTAGSGTTIVDPNGDFLKWGATGGNFHNDVGASSNQSALTIGTGTSGAALENGGSVSGSVNTTFGPPPFPTVALGQIKPGASITHWNNPIDSGFKTLLGGTIVDTLTLTPSSPLPQYAGALPVSAPTLTFNFNFQETPNAGAYGVGGFGNGGSGYCADGSQSAGLGCSDLFGFPVTTLNNPFTLLDLGDDGVAGGSGVNADIMRTYFASVFVLDNIGGAFPIQQLTTGECSALGLAAGCFGFRTAEAAQTTAQFAFAVTTEPVSIPEPGSLALLGLALAGLGVTRMRKSR